MRRKVVRPGTRTTLPIYPACGIGRGTEMHKWTPGQIRRHEQGCRRCQSARGRGRARANDRFMAENPPFELDD